MIPKNTIHFSDKEAERLVSNKNFLNNQNYVLGQRLYKRILHGIRTSKNGKNIIGFNKTQRIQLISLKYIKQETSHTRWLLIICGVIFLIMGLAFMFLGGIIMMFFSFILLYSAFSNSKSNNYGIYKNRDTIIIENKAYFRI